MEHPPCLFTGTHITHPAADSYEYPRANEGNMANDIEEVQNKCLCSICHKTEVFIFVLNQLWAESMYSEHITASFLASGLHPINTKTIPSYKIVASITITSTESRDFSSSCSVTLSCGISLLHNYSHCPMLQRTRSCTWKVWHYQMKRWWNTRGSKKSRRKQQKWVDRGVKADQTSDHKRSKTLQKSWQFRMRWSLKMKTYATALSAVELIVKWRNELGWTLVTGGTTTSVWVLGGYPK